MAFNVSSDLRLVPSVPGDAAISTQPPQPRDDIDEIIHTLAIAPLSSDGVSTQTPLGFPAIQEDEKMALYDRVRPFFECFDDSWGCQEMIDLFHAVVSRGAAEAQYLLGSLIEDYRNDRKSLERPCSFSDEHIAGIFRLAADQGHARAQETLATRYYLGVGVQKNYLEAAKWYARCAENSHDTGLKMSPYFYLAKLFDEGGPDLPQDTRTAGLLFRKAFESTENSPDAGRKMSRALFLAKLFAEYGSNLSGAGHVTM